MTPFVESPPYREDDSDPDAAEMYRTNILAGIVPPKGGDVYTGKISMFPPSDDDLHAIQDQMTRYSDSVKEEEDDDDDDDEDEYEDFMDV